MTDPIPTRSLVLLTDHNAALTLDTRIGELQGKPLADIKWAGRATHGAAAGFRKRWRWQRWIALGATFATGCAIMGILLTVTWGIVTAAARQEAGAEVARWQTWWTASCSDQSPRPVIVADKAVPGADGTGGRTVGSRMCWISGSG